MNNILSNLALIKKRISDACEKSGRDFREVKLLLATKTVSAENIKIALETGEILIGENKVQDVKMQCIRTVIIGMNRKKDKPRVIFNHSGFSYLYYLLLHYFINDNIIISCQ